ncbi:MAG: bifunctional phosphoribosylaminoimidazolecarboxamide formyltransferase/IMP cyclohydrolase [Elusimicrobia bacterium]|nr:bifunctional phosphoribosylaminoimidazolecarboxamide formyltransferase/IMP cyclohydrolase [Candidatus Liberimonas magnetica]
MKIKQALISVSDKTGVVEFAKELEALKTKIISSGGTAKKLKENGIKCREVSEVTNFPEILDGRVKTLNPKIHGGILARRDIPAHLDELKEHSIDEIDLVAVNLYPFEDTSRKFISKRHGEIPGEVIEDIDIGGVALIRAAAKNFIDVLIITEPSDYGLVIEKLKEGKIDYVFKRELAAKAFRHTAYYDSLISSYFTLDKFPEKVSIPLKKISKLRYGENPHQEASLYANPLQGHQPSVITAKQIQGKELSYNNYQDLESAWRLVCEFDEICCAIIKHSNPCGCSQGLTPIDAYKKALSCDPVSAFGGIIALNRGIDEELAKEIVKIFTECVIAPKLSDKAKEIFASRKNIRVLEQAVCMEKSVNSDISTYSMQSGMLFQDRDNLLLNEEKIVTKRKPSQNETQSLLFAWKVAKHVKSNAIVLVRGLQTVGIGAGQMSRIDSLKIASEKMRFVDFKFKDEPLVLASDAFFPFPDVVNESSKIEVSAIIQPGGSIHDEDSIKACDEHNMAMIFTGMRHFRH